MARRQGGGDGAPQVKVVRRAPPGATPEGARERREGYNWLRALRELLQVHHPSSGYGGGARNTPP